MAIENNYLCKITPMSRMILNEIAFKLKLFFKSKEPGKTHCQKKSNKT